MSWAEIKASPESVTQELSANDQEIQLLILDLFHRNEDGKKLLSMLLDKYLYAPVCPPNANSAYGYYREGQNSVLLGIKLIIDSYKNQKG